MKTCSQILREKMYRKFLKGLITKVEFYANVAGL